mgnify:CR=1 FL=1
MATEYEYLIHPTALVDPQAQLAAGVKVGAFSLIGPGVVIGVGSVVESHVVIKGPTCIGSNNHIFQFSSVGETCQDLKYQGEPTTLKIGDNNIIREGCTLHRGTVQGAGVTRIGSYNLLMANVHVAHDCVVGNHVIIANNAALAGHVRISDYAILGGFTAVHQFCYLGAYCMTGVGSVVIQDVPAFVLASGNTVKPHGMNMEGLRRHGFTADVLTALRQAYKVVYRQSLTLEMALEKLNMMATEVIEIQLLIDSIEASTRGIIR